MAAKSGLPAPPFSWHQVALFGVATALFVGGNAVFPGAGVYLALGVGFWWLVSTDMGYWLTRVVRGFNAKVTK